MKNPKKKIKDIAVPSADINWVEELQGMKAQQDWLEKSADIAFRILDELEELGWTKGRLADEMGVSGAQVSKIIKGEENLKLETICKVENALGIKLITIVQQDEEIVKKGSWQYVSTYTPGIKKPFSAFAYENHSSGKSNIKESNYAMAA